MNHPAKKMIEKNVKSRYCLLFFSNIKSKIYLRRLFVFLNMNDIKKFLTTAVGNIFNKLVYWIKNASKFSYSQIIKTFIVSLLIIFSMFLFRYCTNDMIIRDIHNVIYQAEINEEQSLSKRKEIQHNITSHLLSTLYKVKGDRITISELHNSIKSAGNIGFIKLTMTYEEVNMNKSYNIPYISNQYKEQQVTLYNITNYLIKNDYYCGDVDGLNGIDLHYVQDIKQTGGVGYICIMSIKDAIMQNKTIGFVAVSWKDKNHDGVERQEILDELHKLSDVLSPLLTYAPIKSK